MAKCKYDSANNKLNDNEEEKIELGSSMGMLYIYRRDASVYDATTIVVRGITCLPGFVWLYSGVPGMMITGDMSGPLLTRYAAIINSTLSLMSILPYSVPRKPPSPIWIDPDLLCVCMFDVHLGDTAVVFIIYSHSI